MCAGIVGDQLRFAGAGEIGKPRIGNLDRRMQRVDGVEHLLHAVGRRTCRQIDPHAEGEFRLGDAMALPAIDAVPPSAITVSARIFRPWGRSNT